MQKLLQKFCDHGEKIFFHGDRSHQVHVLMCTIDAITMDSYVSGLFHLQEKCHTRVISANPYKKNQILWESIHVYFWISFSISLCLFLDITLLYSNLPDVRGNLNFTVIYLLYWQLHCQFIYDLMRRRVELN